MTGSGRSSLAFVVEQALGHVTHGQNLRRCVERDPEIEAHWVLPEFEPGSYGRRVPLYRSNWSVRAGWQSRRGLRRLGRNTDLDAVLFHTQVTATLSPDLIRRWPSIISLDATPRQYDELGASYGHRTQHGRIESMKAALLSSNLAHARHVVTWSDWAKQGLVDDYGVDPDGVSVIPPGVPTAEWRHEPRPPDHDGPVRLLFVGGDLERKGGDLLLRSFEELGGGNVELDVVTRSPLRSESPAVRVHHDLQPNSPQLKQLFASCDIFVLPTLGDCLPMVLSEAGASGAAIVSTDVGAIPEIVIDGETGVLVPPGDGDQLTSELDRLVREPERRHALASKAADHVTGRYDAERNGERLLHLMKSVAG